MIPTGLTPMVKIETVVNDSDAAAVERLLSSQGVTGWSAIPGLSGFGHHGRRQGRLLFNEKGGETLMITVVPSAMADAIVAGIQELLAARPGVMFVSEVYVSRAYYFEPESSVQSSG